MSKTKTQRLEVPYRTDAEGWEAWKINNNIDGKGIVRVHQLLAISEGEDPKEVFSGGEYHIHHKNGVRWDNRPDNIELLSGSDHLKKHGERGDLGSERWYTDGELLGWLEAFVQEFGVVPSASDVRSWPGPSETAYRNRYGTFVKAVKAAGYTPRSER